MLFSGNSMILLVFVILPNVVWTQSHFTAAVFEHRPQAGKISDEHSIREIIASNLKFYVRAVELASNQGADIIVFNEYGLLPYPGTRENYLIYAEYIPDPRKYKFNPCTANAKDRHILYTLSCLARENGIYLVANMGDAQQCEDTCEIEKCGNSCPEDGYFLYNTDVAFDREGNIVARYHKMHPYFEKVNIPEEPEMITFDTDFGRLGLIVCFDSVFQESMEFVRDHKVDTLIFPTFWFDDILPLNTVEWQQSWAIANGVNFIAANTQWPGNGSIGSGIYTKEEGALVYTYEPDGQSKLIIANVPPTPPRSDIFVVTENDVFPKVETGDKFPDQGYAEIVGPPVDMVADYRYYKSQTVNYSKVKLQEPKGDIKACNNGFCCSLSYSADEMNEDFYLVAFSGKNNVRNYYQWWEETCLLIRCDAFKDEPCVVQPPKSKTVFRNAILSARFGDGVLYPTVSKNRFRLASKKEWNFETKNSQTKLTFTAASDEPLLKIGLLGRMYGLDPPYIPFHKF